MSSVNKVILIGNLGRDPEIRSMRSGDDKVAKLTIATSERWKDRASGERKEKTEWHNVVIFTPQLVAVAEKYLRKGSKIYVEGQLQTRKWQDQKGDDRYSTDVVLKAFVGTLTLLDKAQGADYSGHLEGQTRDGGGQRGDTGGGSGGGTSGGFDPDLDDDVPF